MDLVSVLRAPLEATAGGAEATHHDAAAALRLLGTGLGRYAIATGHPLRNGATPMATISPPPVSTRGLIRVGILALPLGDALKLLGNLGTFNSP